jgi:hypothetical protein
MPGGFNPASQGMGIGPVGIGDPNVIFKRKFRWTLEVEGKGCQFKVPPYFVKVAARPSITFDETEVHFLNEKMYIPGKATWEPLSVTFLDTNQSGSSQLLKWLTAVFDFSEPTSKKMSSKKESYVGEVTLTMYDGCGSPMERWTLSDAWPQAINFGDLDYSSSEVADIQVTLRYSQVKYISQCGEGLNRCDCKGC